MHDPAVRAAAAAQQTVLRHHPALAFVCRLMDWFNRVVLSLSMVVLVAASCVLTYSVLTRYFFKSATDWQDEVSVFLLVGAMFMCTASVQSVRGHVGIEAVASLLPSGVNRVRLLLVDGVSTLFCAFFSWKSWTLLREAWVDGQTTSSSFAPPLWIPYSLMALGMSLLTVQLLLQTAVRASAANPARAPG